MPKYLLLIVEDEAAFRVRRSGELRRRDGGAHGLHEEVSELGGTIVGGEALQPVATATFLRGTRTDGVTTVDNPAPDLKEILGGYYLIEATDDEHARSIGARCPAQFGYIEVRPIWDFAAG